MSNVITEYTLEQAIADGTLVEIFKGHWDVMTGGKPVVATKAIFAMLGPAAIAHVWSEYVDWWKARTEAGLPVDAVFSTHMNGSEVWVLEDQQAVTILYPEEY